MANRITQVAVEALAGPPGPRLTQVAVEALASTVSGIGSRVTQVAVEALEQITPPAPTPAADIRQSQAALEVAHAVPALTVRQTQAALEHVGYPLNAVWQTQACLEVLFPPDWVPPAAGLRNYAYTGLWART